MHLSHPITVFATGASGFVGNTLIESHILLVNALRHSAPASDGAASCVQDTWDNLFLADTLQDWPPQESTVVH